MSAYVCDPGKGSESGNAWQWAWNLACQGHELWVLTPDEDGSVDRLRRASGLENLRFVEVPIPDRLRSTRGQIWVSLRYLGWQRAAYHRARELLADHSFDVVHHVSWGSLVWGSPLWRLGLPFIFGPVGGGQVTPKGYRRYFGGWWVKELLRTWVVRWVLPVNPLTRRTVRRAHMVLAANTDTLRLAEHLGTSRGYLTADTAVPPGYADGAKPRVLVAGETVRIIWIARLYPRKGLRLALEALSLVRDVPWHLTIVGGGPLAARVPVWLKELQIEDRVDWVGQISWDEVRKAYQRAHIMLFSSLRDSMGAQLYEALGCGLPVIALNHHDGAKDMLPDDAAIKVAVGNSDETRRDLSAAIRYLAANPETLHEMSLAALEFAATNTWERKVRETYDLIGRSLRTTIPRL